MLRKWICGIVLPLVIFASSVMPCQAKSEKAGDYEVFIEEEVSVFSDYDLAALFRLMKEGEHKGNLGIYVFADKPVKQEVRSDLGFSSTELEILDSFAQQGNVYLNDIIPESQKIRKTEQDTVDYAFARYEKTYGKQNGSVLVFDMATRYIEIISVGENTKKLNSYRAAIITDNIYAAASREDYYGAASKGIEQIKRVLGGKQIPQTMRIICNIFFAVILSLILNFYILKATSKLPRVSRKTMLKSADVSFNIKDERFEYTHSEFHDLEAGSVEAIVKSKDVRYKLIHALFLIGQIIFFILKAMLSGKSGGGSSGHGGSSHSSGGSRSSGGHRF